MHGLEGLWRQQLDALALSGNRQVHPTEKGLTSGKSSSGRVVGGSCPAAAISMRSFTCPATPCTPEYAQNKAVKLLQNSNPGYSAEGKRITSAGPGPFLNSRLT